MALIGDGFGFFNNSSGMLTVNISPSESLTAGAQWKIDGGDWLDSGSTVSLLPGDYTVSFKSAGTDYVTPGDITVSIGNGSVVTESIVYLNTQYTVDINSNAAEVDLWELALAGGFPADYAGHECELRFNVHAIIDSNTEGVPAAKMLWNAFDTTNLTVRVVIDAEKGFAGYGNETLYPGIGALTIYSKGTVAIEGTGTITSGLEGVNDVAVYTYAPTSTVAGTLTIGADVYDYVTENGARFTPKSTYDITLTQSDIDAYNTANEGSFDLVDFLKSAPVGSTYDCPAGPSAHMPFTVNYTQASDVILRCHSTYAGPAVICGDADGSYDNAVINLAGAGITRSRGGGNSNPGGSDDGKGQENYADTPMVGNDGEAGFDLFQVTCGYERTTPLLTITDAATTNYKPGGGQGGGCPCTGVSGHDGERTGGGGAGVGYPNASGSLYGGTGSDYDTLTAGIGGCNYALNGTAGAAVGEITFDSGGGVQAGYRRVTSGGGSLNVNDVIRVTAAGTAYEFIATVRYTDFPGIVIQIHDYWKSCPASGTANAAYITLNSEPYLHAGNGGGLNQYGTTASSVSVDVEGTDFSNSNPGIQCYATVAPHSYFSLSAISIRFAGSGWSVEGGISNYDAESQLLYVDIYSTTGTVPASAESITVTICIPGGAGGRPGRLAAYSAGALVINNVNGGIMQGDTEEV